MIKQRRKVYITAKLYKQYKKINLLDKCFEASKTHQVSTVGLHRHTQQQVTEDADKSPIDLLTIFICDFCSGHDWEILQLKKGKNNLKNKIVRWPTSAMHKTQFHNTKLNSAAQNKLNFTTQNSISQHKTQFYCTKLNSQYTKLDSRYTKFNSQYTKLNSRYTKLNSQYTKLNSRYTKLNTQKHKTQFPIHKTQIQDMM